MAKELNYDAKKFPVCAPWDGARGPSWVRVFKVNFENGLRTQTDNFSSLHEFLVTETDYGGVNGPAHPVHIKSSETLLLLIGGLHHRQLQI